MAAAAEDAAKGRHKDSVKATEKAGEDVVNVIHKYGSMEATPPVVNITIPPIVIPPIVIPGQSALGTSLKDIGSKLMGIPKS